MNAIVSILIPVFSPFIFAAAALLRGRKSASGILISGAVFHLAASIASRLLKFGDSTIFPRGAHKLYQMLEFGRYSYLLLILISFIFLLSSIYFVRHHKIMESDGKTPSFRQSVYCAAMLAFLGSMALTLAARNLGLLWVAIEATTLFSAPLIIFYRTGGSVEAMWKYLLICSVGIGFALFGTLLIACSVPDGVSPCLSLDALSKMQLDPMLFKAGFIFILAGYGTKADLAPFHNWIPDTYGEAHGPASALISGTLLNASFVAIAKILEIAPDGAEKFCNQLLMTLGFLSVAVAAFFIIRQYDCKRMLGYSSIEHMGIAMLLLTMKGSIILCPVFHLMFHGTFKSALFMVAENLNLSYGTKRIDGIRGVLSTNPLRAVLFMGGLILLCGMPPSPLFITECILVAELNDWQALLLIVLLFLVFAGMLHAAFRMVSGKSNVVPRQLGKAVDIIPLILIVLLPLTTVVVIVLYLQLPFVVAVVESIYSNIGCHQV